MQGHDSIGCCAGEGARRDSKNPDESRGKRCTLAPPNLAKFHLTRYHLISLNLTSPHLRALYRDQQALGLKLDLAPISSHPLSIPRSHQHHARSTLSAMPTSQNEMHIQLVIDPRPADFVISQCVQASRKLWSGSDSGDGPKEGAAFNTEETKYGEYTQKDGHVVSDATPPGQSELDLTQV